MKRRRAIKLVILGVIGVSIWVVFALRLHRTAGPCTRLNDPAMLPDIPEASGLAVSRRDTGVIWSHNDSGHESLLFALDPMGNLLGKVRVPIHVMDWEDVSVGRCPDGAACLYIADIGDNRFGRRNILIYRVPEPAPGDSETAAPDVFSAKYEDGPHNAEAMFVLGEDLFVITRDRTGHLYRSLPPMPDRREMTLQHVGQLDLGVVTDAEASPDEKSVVVRTSHEVVFYRAVDLTRGKILPYLRIPIDGMKESQGEGVAMDGNGMLYLASEGRPWNRSGRLLSLQCKMPHAPFDDPSDRQ